MRPRAGEFELPHVGDVEDAGVLAHRPVLLDDRRVEDGELEAGERDEPRAEGGVTVAKRGAPERLHARSLTGPGGRRSRRRRIPHGVVQAFVT